MGLLLAVAPPHCPSSVSSCTSIPRSATPRVIGRVTTNGPLRGGLAVAARWRDLTCPAADDRQIRHTPGEMLVVAGPAAPPTPGRGRRRTRGPPPSQGMKGICPIRLCTSFRRGGVSLVTSPRTCSRVSGSQTLSRTCAHTARVMASRSAVGERSAGGSTSPSRGGRWLGMPPSTTEGAVHKLLEVPQGQRLGPGRSGQHPEGVGVLHRRGQADGLSALEHPPFAQPPWAGRCRAPTAVRRS